MTRTARDMAPKITDGYFGELARIYGAPTLRPSQKRLIRVIIEKGLPSLLRPTGAASRHAKHASGSLSGTYLRSMHPNGQQHGELLRM